MDQELSADWFALSEAQRAHWFLYRLQPAAQGLHNIGFAARLSGQLDARALQDALQQLLSRHPALRASFRQEGDEPQQTIRARARAELHEVDAGALAPDRLDATIQADLVRPFDLRTGPLMRTHLYRVGARESVILLAFDHLALDGWSYWLVLEQLGALLEGAALAPPGAATYRDFVAAQQAWLASPAADLQLRYWQQELAGELPTLTLPVKSARPAAFHRRETVDLDVPPALAQRFDELTRLQRGTPFSTLLSAYFILLHRYSGQRDLLVGAPLPGRTEARWNEVVGNFVNPVALRARLTDGMRVDQLLRQVRGTALRGLAHQDLPFAHVARSLRRTPADAPPALLQTLFLYQRARHGAPLARLWERGGHAARGEWGGRALAPYPINHSGALGAIGLVLEAMHGAGQLRCALHYDPALFERGTVERMAAHLLRLLDEMAADPTRPVAELALLDAAEYQQLLGLGSGPSTPDAPMVHEMFERQAMATPLALAVAHDDGGLSYQQLNHRADLLAHSLRCLGVRAGQRVATYLERGPDMVVALLGVLKAGAVYVPLNIDHPIARIAYMLTDCAPAVVLTQAPLRAALLAAGSAAPVLLVGAPSAAAPPAPASGPGPLTPRHLAYIIYTSGSTGKPKGVMVEHGNIANLIEDWRQRYRHVHHGDAFAASVWTSSGFDVSLFELLAPLVQGGTLHIVPEALRADPPALLGWLREHRIAQGYLPPFLLRYLKEVAAAQIGQLALKLVLVGVEPLAEADLHRLARLRPGLVLVNGYGPTEATVYCTTYHPLAGRDRVAPIGRPIANTSIHILDGDGRHVPLGVTGEIHVGGDGVAQGYLRQPGLTAARFICDPFSARPGARLYRTGDLGRWLPEGVVEFIGRSDSQVKIRGMRVEPGEIAARILGCEGVRDAVVVTRQNQAGQYDLLAYIVPRDGARLDPAALRAQLAVDLPTHMLPLAYVVMAALPLGPNGKLDAARLPAPAPTASDGREPPQGDLETRIAVLWQELLGLDDIGRDEQFFERGGHSLLAAQLAARIGVVLAAEIPLRELFIHTTVRAQATLVRAAQRPRLPPIGPAAAAAELPLSWAQQRLWFLDQFTPESPLYNMPAAIRLRGGLDAAAFGATLNDIVARHDALRTVFTAREGRPLQRVVPRVDLALPLIDLCHLSRAERDERTRQLTRQQAEAPFDLARGPLIRASLVRLAEQEHVLLITLHHIVSDGWSMTVLVAEIAALYTARTQNRPSPLQPLPIQYADFAVWQRQWINDDYLAPQLAYWLTQLADAPAMLALPTDRPRPAVPQHRGATLRFAIGADTTARLTELGGRTRTTLFMTLAAVFQLLLARYSGQSDICIGTPVASRGRAELEPLIGFFVNTLVLRGRIDGAQTVGEWLADARVMAVEAFANQELPFEQLVDALKLERHVSHHPLFQVMLTFQKAPTDALELPGITWESMDTSVAAKFDLTLNMSESADGLSASLDYDVQLFDHATIARMAEHFTRLLEAVLANPDGRVGELSLMGPAEQRQILHEWNATAVEFADHASLQQLFERQVARTPEAAALEFDGHTISYALLNERANRLAERLLRVGAGPEVAVAICIERSPAMVIGLLAILKTGAPYVALDPGYPAARLRYMLEDAAPAVLLTQPHLPARLPDVGVPILYADDGGDDASPTGNPPQRARPGNLAYILYTSGSTGAPKGVAMSMGALYNMIMWQIDGERRQHHSGGRTLQFASLNFDVSFQEIYSTLCAGHTLILINDELRLDMPGLRRFLSHARIGQAFLPNAVLQQLAASPSSEVIGTHPCNIMTAGEKLQVGAALSALTATLRSNFMLNQYGPSETHLATEFCLAAADREGWPTSPPIGRPIANVRVYVLDASYGPVPVGVVGELYIAGDGLARGYVRQPALTAERFLPDPHGTAPGARMYRSGDLARYLPDGNLEYMGRTDNQIKLRGFRIELDEVVAALAALPVVHEAAVLVHTDADGDKRLAAYIVPVDDAALDVGALRASLAAGLPDYMVPSFFIPLDRLPLTPNGKVDRQALPPPGSEVHAQGYVAPRNETEKLLAAVWTEVLKLDRVGIHDNFFAIGGHSLLATQLMFRVRAACQIELPVRTLFEASTVAELATRIAHLQWLRNDAALADKGEVMSREEI